MRVRTGSSRLQFPLQALLPWSCMHISCMHATQTSPSFWSLLVEYKFAFVCGPGRVSVQPGLELSLYLVSSFDFQNQDQPNKISQTRRARIQSIYFVILPILHIPICILHLHRYALQGCALCIIRKSEILSETKILANFSR